MVALMLVASLMLTNVAYAKKGNKNDKWQKRYEKKFQDVLEDHWANKAIEKMGAKDLILGDEFGNYQPNSSTKKIEVLIMALRIMGWEDEARLYDELPENYTGKEVAKWAVGYVALAYEKGLLQEDELKKFNPNSAAKRYEVAKYITRALGLEEDDIGDLDELEDYKDRDDIPEGNEGYVNMIISLQLMIGFNNSFNPNSSLSRAEMAVLFSRLDDKVDSNEDQVEMGAFVDYTA